MARKIRATQTKRYANVIIIQCVEIELFKKNTKIMLLMFHRMLQINTYNNDLKAF